MAEPVPVPPKELTDKLEPAKDDSAAAEAYKIRTKGALESMYVQGLVDQIAVHQGGARAVGVQQ